MDPNNDPLGSPEPDSPKKARTQRSRPSKSLPSDRMKFEVQVRVLQTFARLSVGGRVISPESLSDALNNEVSKYTAPLSHGFFVESGWLTKAGRGEYAATDALTAYNRRSGTGADDPIAPLRMTAKGSWYWRSVEPLLQHGGANVSEVMVALMNEATVGEAHKPQVRMLLEWLRFLGLISLNGDKVMLTSAIGEASADAANLDSEQPLSEPEPEPEPEHDSEPVSPGRPLAPARAEVSRPTTSQPGGPRPMLTFDFSVAVTADDLAQLDPDQIRALFEAVGTVAAITKKSE